MNNFSGNDSLLFSTLKSLPISDIFKEMLGETYDKDKHTVEYIVSITNSFLEKTNGKYRPSDTSERNMKLQINDVKTFEAIIKPEKFSGLKFLINTNNTVGSDIRLSSAIKDYYNSFKFRHEILNISSIFKIKITSFSIYHPLYKLSPNSMNSFSNIPSTGEYYDTIYKSIKRLPRISQKTLLKLQSGYIPIYVDIDNELVYFEQNIVISYDLYTNNTQNYLKIHKLISNINSYNRHILRCVHLAMVSELCTLSNGKPIQRDALIELKEITSNGISFIYNSKDKSKIDIAFKGLKTSPIFINC